MSYNYTPGDTIDEVVRSVVEGAFKWFRGNKTHASSAIGISINTLSEKLKKYKDDDEYRKQREEREAEARKMARLSIASGISMESASNTSSKSEVPLQERPQIQEMLPSYVARSGRAKAGRNL